MTADEPRAIVRRPESPAAIRAAAAAEHAAWTRRFADRDRDAHTREYA